LGISRYVTVFSTHSPSCSSTPLPSALKRLDCPVGPHKPYGPLFTRPAIRERPAAPRIPPDTILSYQPQQHAGWTAKLANLNQEIEKVLLRLETSIGEGLSCGAR